MRHILLAIHSASHEIYQNNVKSLMAGYKQIIKKHSLDIDVVVFCGTYDDKDHEYIEGYKSEFHEKEIANVLFDAIGEVLNIEKYDVIIKTNTNTVVNIPLLWKFCNSVYFDPEVVYSNVCYQMYDANDFNVNFPSGMFIMADKNIWGKIINTKESAMKFIDDNVGDNKSVSHTYEDAKEKLVWVGYSDEFLIGICLKLNDVPIRTLASSTISSTKREFFANLLGIGLFDDINPKYASINCKMDIGNNLFDLLIGSDQEYFRIQYENYMISSICKIFESYNPEYDDLQFLFDNIIYHG